MSRSKSSVLAFAVVLTLALPLAAHAQGITNGGFEQPGPNGANEASADGWQLGALAGGDNPAAEAGGAGGSAGRMRVGDDPKTPAPQLGPPLSAIAQSFDCAMRAEPAKFCNFSFSSAYVAALGEVAFVAVMTPGGVQAFRIPPGALFAPHGFSLPGCFPGSSIAFAVQTGGGPADSTLYVDDVKCSCDDRRREQDLEPYDLKRPDTMPRVLDFVLNGPRTLREVTVFRPPGRPSLRQ